MKKLLMLGLALVVSAGQAAAQEGAPATSSDHVSPFSIGVQATTSAYGFSGIYRVTPRVAGQVVVGSAGYGTALTGRGIYSFDAQESFTPFVYAALGTWTGFEDTSVITTGLGAGAEFDLGRFSESLKNLTFTLEAGFTRASVEDISVTQFGIGPALHYRL